jgi:uncharacterized membrane protein YccC
MTFGRPSLKVKDPGRFALKNAVRAAIVVPAGLAVGLKVFGSGQMGLMGAFGGIGLLFFVDFGGSQRQRFSAYLAVVLLGAVTISLGTLCSRSTPLAVVAMALIGFAILFAGITDGYAAAASLVLILTFVIGVMVTAAPDAIPDRLAGWGVASLFSLTALFALWPGRPPDQIRKEAAAALEDLADLLEAKALAAGPADRHSVDDDRLAALATRAFEATAAVRDGFVAVPRRPNGVGRRAAALGRLIDDLDWLDNLAREQPGPAAASSDFAAERAAVEASVPAALSEAAERVRRNDPGTDAPELRRLEADQAAVSRAFLAAVAARDAMPDADRLTAELDEAYRLGELAVVVVEICRHAIEVGGGDPSGPVPSARESIFARARRVADSHAAMNSVWLHNSLRGAAGLALAVLVARVTDAQNGFWVVLGTISVLRSSALATGRTVVQAILGTALGIVVGGAIVAAIGSDHTLIWIVLPFAIGLAAYSPRAISFAAGQAGFTIAFVILFDLLGPGGWTLGVVRIEDIAIGCLISLVVGYLFWPRGATDVLRAAIGDAFVAGARFLDQTIATLLGVERAAQTRPSSDRADEAALRLDETVREYLAERTSAHGKLDDLARLIGGAARLRRVATLMRNGSELAPLGPVESQAPWVSVACGLFDEQWRSRRDWYEEFGRAVAAGEALPGAEAASGAAGVSSRLRRRGPEVVIDPATESGGIPPGLPIAWAERHLGELAAMEEPMVAAARDLTFDGPRAS